MKAKKPASTAQRRETTPYLEAAKHFEEGIQLLYSKSLKKAKEAFQVVIENYPDEKEMIDRAQTYIKVCDINKARHTMALDTAEEYFTRGTFRFNEGDYDGAIADYQEAMRVDPKLDYLPYSVASVHAVKGDIPQAAKALEKAIKLNPEIREQALHDDDFAGMIEEPAFVELLQVHAK